MFFRNSNNQIKNSLQKTDYVLNQRFYPIILISLTFIYVLLLISPVLNLFVSCKIIILSKKQLLLNNLISSYFLLLTFILLNCLLGLNFLNFFKITQILIYKLEKFIFSFFAGLTFTSFIFLLLAFTNILNSYAIIVYFLMVFLLSLKIIFAFFKSYKESIYSFLSSFNRKITDITMFTFIIIVIITLSYPVFIQTLLPNTDWDSAMYHLPLAKRLLNGEIFNYDPLLTSYSNPAVVSLLYAFFIAFGLDSAIIPFNLLISIFILLCLYAFHKRFFSAWSGIIAILLCVSSNIFWELSVDPRIDNFLACAVLISFYSIILWFKEDFKYNILYLTAIGLNLAIGSKFTGLLFLFYLYCIVLITLLFLFINKRKTLYIKKLCIFCLLTFIPNSFWYISNFIIHSDPVYPRLSNIYFADKSGKKIDQTKELNKLITKSEYEKNINEQAARISKHIGEHSQKKSLLNFLDLINNSHEYTRKPFHYLSPLFYIFILVPFFNRSKIAIFFVTSITVFYLFFAYQTYLIRYIFFLIPLSAAAGALIPLRFPKQIIIFSIILLILIPCYQNYKTNKFKVEIMEFNSYLSASQNHLDWLLNKGYNNTPAMAHAIKYINFKMLNNEMSKYDKILMIGEGKGNLLNCEYIPDFSWKMLRWTKYLLTYNLNLENIFINLKKEKITHILYNKGYFGWVFKNNKSLIKQILFSMIYLNSFIESYGKVEYDKYGIIIIRLK